MKKRLNIIYITSACIIAGALVFFFTASQSESIEISIYTGVFFAFILFLLLAITHQLIIKKLKIFSGLRPVFIQTFLYVIIFALTVLGSLIFYTVITVSLTDFDDFLYKRIINGLVYFINILLTYEQPTDLIAPHSRGILLTIFMMTLLLGIVSLLSSFIEIKWRETRQKQLIYDAELKTLRAQIEPHFLFNSLNTIVNVINQDPKKAEELLIKLSELLHYKFNRINTITVSLKDELNFIRNYLILMKARFSDKLNFEINELCDNSEIEIPAFLIQPVVENAIKHGWSNKSNPFNLSIKIKATNGIISIEIKDNGIGMNQEKLNKLPVKGHALENLMDRLVHEYHENDLIKIESQPNKGTLVKIKLPVKK